jgi:hypothetical protein
MDVTPRNDKNEDQPPQKEALPRLEATPKPGRRPYEKPAFRFERVFETAALSCGKVVITQSQCNSNRKTS